MSCNMQGGVRSTTLALIHPPNPADTHTHTPKLPYTWLTLWFAFKRRLRDRESYKAA